MRKICIKCNSVITPDRGTGAPQYRIAKDICGSCIQGIADKGHDAQRELLESFHAPILLMQPEPRRVRTANEEARFLFGKDLSQIEGFKGGEVFNCEHAFTEAGCGVDEHCQDCIIRTTIIETFNTGKSFNSVAARLDIRNGDKVKPYSMTISTEKLGELALVRVDQFEEKL